MTTPKLDFAALSKVLCSAVISDALDSLGYTEQVLRPFVRPLDDDSIVFGPARTGLFMPRHGHILDENPYDIEIELIDDLQAGDVPVFACGGPIETITPWGELLTTAAMQRGACGFITDGQVRDVRAIRKVGFPVYHGGIRPLDSAGRSKMMLRDTRVQCAGVTIEPGDLIFADVDGVVVIPFKVASEVVEKAIQKIEGENTTRNELLEGKKLAEIYEKYGIL
jgi:4-hydroxy-4-methyl-2-oxoglutarate aldolase